MRLKIMPVLLLGIFLSSNAYSRTCHYTCTPPTCYPYDDPITWNHTTNNPDNVPPGMNPDGSFLVDSETAATFGKLHPEAWDHNPSTPRSEKTQRALDAARIVLFQNVSQITRLPGFARTYVSLDGRLGPDGSQLPVVFVGIDDRNNPKIRADAAAQASETVKGMPVSLQFYSEFKPFDAKDLADTVKDTEDQNCTPPSDAELHPDQALYNADAAAAQAVITTNLSTLKAIPGYAQSSTSLDSKERIGPNGVTITVIVVQIDDLDGPDNCADSVDVGGTGKSSRDVFGQGIRRSNKAIRKAAAVAAPASLGNIPVELMFYSDIVAE
jgi:hypothetical protein